MKPLSMTPLIAAALSMAALACGGSALQYDRPPAPGWITKPPTGIGPATLTAVGAAPATIHVNRDRELATRHAKSQVAQLFESKISARVSDWSLAMTGGATEVNLSGMAQSIEVRSDVTVEDVTLQAEYRDEDTRTHYVRITVDRVAWARRLHERIGDRLSKFESAVQAARRAAGKQRPLAALKSLLSAAEHGRRVEPDVTVIDLIDHKSGAREKLDRLRETMNRISRSLRADYRFTVTIDSPDPRAAAQFRAALEQFLSGFGFALSKDGRIKIDAEMGQRRLSPRQVAGRTEHRCAASGSLRVQDADGSEVPELTVQFKGDRYRERAASPKKAAARALSLAADTLSAKFNSAFRRAYADPGSR